MVNFRAVEEWENQRTREDVISDILKANAFAHLCEVSVEGHAEEDEVIANALTSIARSMITLNELILRGYTFD